MAPIPYQQLTSPMATIEVGTDEDKVVFHVHKEILTSNSPFFNNALNGGFMEARLGLVPLPDDDPDIVYRMINWLYTHEVDDRNDVREPMAGSTPKDDSGSENDEENDSRGSRAEEEEDGQPAAASASAGPNALFKLWIMADKFMMPELMDAVTQQLLAFLNTQQLHALHGTESSVNCDPVPSVDTLQYVYDNTMESASLRDLAILIAVMTWKMGSWSEEYRKDMLETLTPEVWQALLMASLDAGRR
ncbi:hypothetical protein SLS58_005464 [Diplodia intermedia]|uniref:BTB domain-containing protein n=1 Tax=Diplodia intermedia TaxID=856260 RepID=A0ABR3TQL8_9PEZI